MCVSGSGLVQLWYFSCVSIFLLETDSTLCSVCIWVWSLCRCGIQCLSLPTRRSLWQCRTACHTCLQATQDCCSRQPLQSAPTSCVLGACLSAGELHLLVWHHSSSSRHALVFAASELCAQQHKQNELLHAHAAAHAAVCCCCGVGWCRSQGHLWCCCPTRTTAGSAQASAYTSLLRWPHGTAWAPAVMRSAAAGSSTRPQQSARRSCW